MKLYRLRAIVVPLSLLGTPPQMTSDELDLYKEKLDELSRFTLQKFTKRRKKAPKFYNIVEYMEVHPQLVRQLHMDANRSLQCAQQYLVLSNLNYKCV